MKLESCFDAVFHGWTDYSVGSFAEVDTLTVQQLDSSISYLNRKEVELVAFIENYWGTRKDALLDCGERSLKEAEISVGSYEHLVGNKEQLEKLQTEADLLVEAVEKAKQEKQFQQQMISTLDLLERFYRLSDSLKDTQDDMPWDRHSSTLIDMRSIKEDLVKQGDFVEKEKLAKFNVTLSKETKRFHERLKHEIARVFRVVGDQSGDLEVFLMDKVSFETLWKCAAENGLSEYVEHKTHLILYDTIECILRGKHTIQTIQGTHLKLTSSVSRVKAELIFDNLGKSFNFFHENLKISAFDVATKIDRLISHELQEVLYEVLYTQIPDSLAPADIEHYIKWLHSQQKLFQEHFLDVFSIFDKWAREVFHSGIEKKVIRVIAEARIQLLESKLESVVVGEASLHVEDLAKILNITKPEQRKISAYPELNQPYTLTSYITDYSVFLLPTCRINARAKMIMDQFESIWEEFTHLSETYRETATEGLLDILDFLEITYPPSIEHRGMHKIPQQILLVHNELMYCFHRLVQIMFKLPVVKTEKFVQAGRRLLRTANKTLKQALNLQNEEISLILTVSTRYFSTAHTLTGAEELNISMKQILDSISRMAKIWRPILPAHLYLSSLSQTINSTCESIYTLICNLNDLQEEECETLYSIIGNGTPIDQFPQLPSVGLSKSLLTLLNRETDVISKMQNLNDPRVQGTYLPVSLKKVDAALSVLHNTMAETMNKFREGYFRSGGMENRQVAKLIMKVFSDSDRRMKAIREIEDSNSK